MGGCGDMCVFVAVWVFGLVYMNVLCFGGCDWFLCEYCRYPVLY